MVFESVTTLTASSPPAARRAWANLVRIIAEPAAANRGSPSVGRGPHAFGQPRRHQITALSVQTSDEMRVAVSGLRVPAAPAAATAASSGK